MKTWVTSIFVSLLVIIRNSTKLFQAELLISLRIQLSWTRNSRKPILTSFSELRQIFQIFGKICKKNMKQSKKIPISMFLSLMAVSSCNISLFCFFSRICEFTEILSMKNENNRLKTDSTQSYTLCRLKMYF